LIKWAIKFLQDLINLLKRKEKEYTLKTLAEDKVVIKNHTEVKGVNLLIIRDTFTDESTMGELFVEGEKFCDTLELPYLDNKKSVSCIPVGEYSVRFRYPRESATRDYLHLLVKDVPNRDYILFHRGNSAKDTRGCILVGYGSQHNKVNNSTLAMDLLIKELINCGKRTQNIKLIIKNK